eukprot:Trichotokara_eunicae@DN4780_c0_g1_i5.p1
MMDIPVRIKETESALHGLIKVKSSLDKMKTQMDALLWYNLIWICTEVFPWSVLKYIVSHINDRVETLFTNVAGPSCPGAIGGAQIGEMYFWAPVKNGMETSVSCISFGDQINLMLNFDNVLAKPHIIKHPNCRGCALLVGKDTLRCIEETFKELKFDVAQKVLKDSS